MALLLVVDDDSSSRQLLAYLLTPYGHRVLEVADGREGLERLRTITPDLVICDILMPTMNGYQFVTEMRKSPVNANIPVVFHSASYLDKEARSLGAVCGVSLFLPKPCEPEQAILLVHQALGLPVKKPADTQKIQVQEDAISLLIDERFEKGKELDSLSYRMSSLLEFAMDLAQDHDQSELLEITAKAARKIVGGNYSGIGILAGPQSLHLRAFATLGGDPAALARPGHTDFAGPIFEDIVQGRGTQRIFKPADEPGGLDISFNHPQVRSFLGVPMLSEGLVYGWIYVAEKLAALEFTEEDTRILEAIAAHVALALAAIDRMRKIQDDARKLKYEIEERRQAEERFRILVETAPTAIVITDERGRITEVNAQTLDIFGYDRLELIGELVEKLLPGRLKHTHEAHRAQYMQHPHARPMGMGMELFGRRKDGTEFPVEISLGPLVTREGVHISSTIVDITERKKMERHFQLAQRQEAIGTLAGGVAHDFNNLLSIILGCSELAMEALPKDHPVVKKLEMVRKAGASAAGLTRQLLAFSRQQMLQPRVLDLKEVVERTESMLRRLIGEDIATTIFLDPALGRVSADPGQIEQVLVNLTVNARDAMPRGGQLTITGGNVELDATYKDGRNPVVPGSYVMLAIEDNGCGMDRQTQAKIFDPFFTTKELGKGTGLGLSTVYGIVKQSGGYIWVYSEPDKGTTFKIYLPRVHEHAAPLDQPEVAEVAARGSETILLAEDSESLREMTAEYLASLGFTVLAAGSGAAALQKAYEYNGKIHLLLTDMVMPEMSGPDLAGKLAAIRPGMKIIFTSGYTADKIARQGVLDSSAAFIQKPYRPKALARQIRDVLDDCSRTACSPAS